MHLRRISAPLAVVSILLLGAACSASEGQRSAQERPSPAAHDAAGHHAAGHHAAGHHAAGHHAATGTTSVTSALVGVSDLPAGYTQGGHHEAAPAGTAPEPTAACAPLAELLGAHPAVRQHEHPQAAVSFSKSHFGPALSETVIDYGRQAAAAQALRQVGRAGEECGRYVQSTSPSGANVYTVRPVDATRGDAGGVAVRLAAVGDEFGGLYWDVWATRSGSRLAAVAFRSVPGGDNDDWHAAIPAALAALERS